MRMLAECKSSANTFGPGAGSGKVPNSQLLKFEGSKSPWTWGVRPGININLARKSKCWYCGGLHLHP